MANFPKIQPKITIPTNKPFAVEYKGAKLNLEQEFYYEGGDIYIHIPATICRRADNIGDDPVVLSDRFQKDLSHLNWDGLNPDNIVICNIERDRHTGVCRIVPDLDKTKMIQASFRIEPFDLSDTDLCFQYAESYNAIDGRIDEIDYVHTQNIKAINNWLAGDHYQIVPTCDKWEHLRSYTGESMSEAVFLIQCQVDEPPKHIDLESHIRAFDESMSRNRVSMSVDMKEQLRKAQIDYVAHHNKFVDSWLQM